MKIYLLKILGLLFVRYSALLNITKENYVYLLSSNYRTKFVFLILYAQQPIIVLISIWIPRTTTTTPVKRQHFLSE